MGYQRPVPYSRSTSWAAHRRRNPPSSEPGIDMFCAIGTPVLAAESGRIVDTGDSIGPATGRFVTIDLDDGRRVRYLHLKSRTVRVGDRVRRSQVIGYSGATGYGEEDWSWNVAETGGAHVHMTLWLSQRYVFGSYGAVDPEPYFDADGAFAGDEATPAKPKEWDEMASRDEVKQAAKEGMVEALKDSTNLLAQVVKNELDWKMYGDLSVIPIAELNNAKHLCAFSTQRMIHVQQQAHVDLIVRAVENRGEDIMGSSEMDIVKGYCRAVYPRVGFIVDAEALSAALREVSVSAPKQEISEKVWAAVDAATSADTQES